MKVTYSHTAQKQLQKLPKKKQLAILQKIHQLKSNPHAGKKLKGKLSRFYSLKIWPYRIIYQHSPKTNSLFINIIQHRQQAYK
jgi:mRNA-degrading endonuclease RelE of RelBE toxin-antitoxin system